MGEEQAGSGGKGCVILVLELPQRMNGGDVMSWDDLERIRSLCTERGVRMHMDGARLFEAAQYYEKGAPEVAKLFDSVYISFYKGLGSIGGAALIGDTDFLQLAKRHEARIGTIMVSSAPSRW